MVVEDLLNLNEHYGIIYTDPPWEQKRGGYKSVRPNTSGKELDYNIMKIDDIIQLHKHVFENNAATKHNVFIWTIDKYLRQTEDFMEDLGYVRHARIIWDKVTGIPTAFTIRYSHEYLLWFYKKGNILMPREEVRGIYSDVIREKVKKHSKKPECAYLMLEDMFPNVNKLEMFARNTRQGWDSWGNECENKEGN